MCRLRLVAWILAVAGFLAALPASSSRLSSPPWTQALALAQERGGDRGGGGDPGPARGPAPQPDQTRLPERQLQLAYARFRSTVLSSLREAARRANVRIDESHFSSVAIRGVSADGSVVVGAVAHAAVAGVERLTLEQLARGADVMFIFLPFAVEGLAPGDNDGFYTVRVFKEGEQWRFQLRNRSGQTVLAGTARPRIAAERLDEVKEVYRRGVPYILVDHGKLNVKLAFYTTTTPQGSPQTREAGAFGEIEISFKVDLRIARSGQDAPSGPGKQILDAAEELARNGVRGVTSTLPDKSWRTMVIGGADGFFVLSASLLEFLDIDKLARGENAFVLYTHGTALPDGFYVVRLFREATGQWKAQFRDARTGRVVFTGDAVVIERVGEGTVFGFASVPRSPGAFRRAAQVGGGGAGFWVQVWVPLRYLVPEEEVESEFQR